MKISVIGTGYVGLVTGTCLAESGNQVICMDIDDRKIEMLNDGKIADLRAGPRGAHQAEYRPRRGSPLPPTWTSAVRHGDIIFIAVGTPPGEDGSADLKYVLGVAREIGKYHERLQGRGEQEHGPRRDRRQGPGGGSIKNETQVRRGVESGISEGRGGHRGLHEARPRRDRRGEPEGHRVDERALRTLCSNRKAASSSWTSGARR